MTHETILEGMREDMVDISDALDRIGGTPAYKKAEKELVGIREQIAAVKEFLDVQRE